MHTVSPAPGTMPVIWQEHKLFHCLWSVCILELSGDSIHRRFTESFSDSYCFQVAYSLVRRWWMYWKNYDIRQTELCEPSTWLQNNCPNNYPLFLRAGLEFAKSRVLTRIIVNPDERRTLATWHGSSCKKSSISSTVCLYIYVLTTAHSDLSVVISSRNSWNYSAAENFIF